MGASDRALGTAPSEDPRDRAVGRSELSQGIDLARRCVSRRQTLLYSPYDLLDNRAPPPNGMDQKCRQHPALQRILPGTNVIPRSTQPRFPNLVGLES